MSDPLPQHSIDQTQDQLAQLVHQAEQGTPVEITRQGKRVAIILSIEDFDRLSSQKGTFGQSLADFRSQWGIEILNLNPEEVFQDVRDRLVTAACNPVPIVTNSVFPQPLLSDNDQDHRTQITSNTKPTDLRRSGAATCQPALLLQV